MDGTARFRFGLAVVCTVFAAVFGWMLRSVQWHPHADFDVLGVLWLLQNLGAVVLWVMFWGLLLIALYSWSVFLLKRG